MASFCKVIIIGRLTRDPVARTVGAGSARVTEFGIAFTGNRKKDASTGQWTDEPCFLECKAWNRGEQGRQLATTAEMNLVKGKEVALEGHLRQESWTDSQSGQKRSKHVLEIDSITFVGPKDATAQAGSRPASQAPAQQGQSEDPEDPEDIPF